MSPAFAVADENAPDNPHYPDAHRGTRCLFVAHWLHAVFTLTWTSMNIDGYLQHVHAGLSKLEQLLVVLQRVVVLLEREALHGLVTPN